MAQSPESSAAAGHSHGKSLSTSNTSAMSMSPAEDPVVLQALTETLAERKLLRQEQSSKASPADHRRKTSLAGNSQARAEKIAEQKSRRQRSTGTSDTTAADSGNQTVESSRPSPADTSSPRVWQPPSSGIPALPASFAVVDAASDPVSKAVEPSDPTEAAATPEIETFLDELSTDFKTKVEDSGLDPASPQYRTLWNNEAMMNDIRFKATYGDQAWLRHHAAVSQIDQAIPE